MFTHTRLGRFLLALCGALGAIGMAGCTTDPFRSGTEGALRERITTTSANPLFDERTLEKIDLVALIDPNLTVRVIDKDKPLDDVEFERALDRFYNLPDREGRRNRVVDRIMVASEQRCTIYKNYLKRVETYQGFVTGVLTTILGAAGGISTVTNTSRFFSGLAGISSGVGAELKHDFFADTASLVIVPGIDQRRETLERAIRGRFQEPISRYTLEAALQDGAKYHGACSLLAGLQQAGVSIRDVRNPGLLAVNETLRQLSVTKRLLDSPLAALDPTDVVNQPQSMTVSPVGALGAVAYASETPTGKLLASKAEALALLDRLAAKAKEVLDTLEKDKKANVANLDSAIAEVKKLVADAPQMATNRGAVETKITSLHASYAASTDELDKLAQALRRAIPEERNQKGLALLQKEREFDATKYLALRMKLEALRIAVTAAITAIDSKDSAKIQSAATPVATASTLN
jgi:hypothetical protein